MQLYIANFASNRIILLVIVLSLNSKAFVSDISSNYSMLSPGDASWYADTGASSHMTPNMSNLSSVTPYNGSDRVVVGNGTQLPISYTGHGILSTSNSRFSLRDILLVPQLSTNLLSVRKFVTDNSCSMNFDPFGFSIKDLMTKKLLLCCNSPGPLYAISSHFGNSAKTSHSALAAAHISPNHWHRHLGHPSSAVLASLVRINKLPCSSFKSLDNLCNACPLGKHQKLPFMTSCSFSSSPFELIHSDIWTSPVPYFTGFRYYILFHDDFTKFSWVFPLKRKSDVFSTFKKFYAYILTQFSAKLKAFQCDGATEFVKLQAFRSFLDDNGILLRISCPHTHQQNGKAERMHHTILNMVRSLLFQASLPSQFWVEVLHTAVHLLNILPSPKLHFRRRLKLFL